MIRDVYKALYCTECESLCYLYEQGLCCNCGNPWETYEWDEDKYPKYWEKVTVVIYNESECK